MAKKKEKEADLKGFSVMELRKQAATLAEDLFGLKIQNNAGQLENTARVRLIRRQIARVKTLISQKTAGR